MHFSPVMPAATEDGAEPLDLGPSVVGAAVIPATGAHFGAHFGAQPGSASCALSGVLAPRQ